MMYTVVKDYRVDGYDVHCCQGSEGPGDEGSVQQSETIEPIDKREYDYY